MELKPPSWEKPIEKVILGYCKDMRDQWKNVEEKHSSLTVRENAANFVLAYQTVADFIEREIKLRASHEI